MTAGRDVLRTMWGEGIRAVVVDGQLRLRPGQLVTPDVIALAKAAKPEILEVLATLPASGRCSICGEPNGIPWSIGSHCVTCALIAADALRAEGVIPPHDISPIAQKGAA